jgi:hypothetical protein
MRRRRILQIFVILALGEAVVGSGCIHHHYYSYGQQPGCDPVGIPGAVRSTSALPAPTAAAPGTVAYGEVCDVPALSGPAGAVAVGPGSRAVAATPRPSRVMVSEPAGEGYSIRAGRAGWRRTDPEIATTRVEGAMEGSVIR